MPEPPALVQTRHQYEHVFGIYVPIALGVFAAIVLVTLFAVLRYRRRAPEQAARWHENNAAELAYAALLVCTIAFLLYVTFGAEHKVDTVSAQERPQLTVDVYGSKWEWRFHYRTLAIDRYSGTVGRESLVLPSGEAVRLRLISRDVIHEFWVPELRYKHDLIPGRAQPITVTFPRSGTFAGQCAEFCGLYHARMVFDVQVLSPAQFAAWASEHGRAAVGAAGGRAAAAAGGRAAAAAGGRAAGGPGGRAAPARGQRTAAAAGAGVRRRLGARP
jgi:cytochrome c oxidase subunit II